MRYFLPLIVMLLWAISVHAHEDGAQQLPPLKRGTPYSMIVYTDAWAMSYGTYDDKAECEEAAAVFAARLVWSNVQARCFPR